MRKGAAPKRPVVKDPVYGSETVSQLVNKVLLAVRSLLQSALCTTRWRSAARRPAPIRF